MSHLEFNNTKPKPLFYNKIDIICRTIKQSGCSFRIKIIGVQGELGYQNLIFLGKCGMYRVPALYRFLSLCTGSSRVW